MPALQSDNCSCKAPHTVIQSYCDIKTDCAKDMKTGYCDNMDCDSTNCDNIGCDTENTNNNNPVKETQTTCYKLLTVNEVPDYAKETSITTGYRTCLDYGGCFRSIFWLHNETVNIWTHLLGFFFFLWLMVDNLVRPQDHIRDFSDYFATAIQLITYQACMLSSSLFHTLLCHSAVVKSAWQELDHACILIALYGTYVRIIINNFQCFPMFRLAHLAFVTALFGSVLWMKYRPKSSSSKVSLPMFMTMALYSVAPFGHWIQLSHSILNTNVDPTMISWMFFPYLVGAVGVLFYISHFPEVVVPTGQVDLCGSSHQIWHVLIFSGMASWYYLSCWVSTTRPLTCTMVEDVTCPVSSWCNLATPSGSLLNSSFAQILF